jgi:hypothetical protein
MLFWISSLLTGLCTIVRILYLARAGRTRFEWPPRMTYRRAYLFSREYFCAHVFSHKNCVAAVQQPHRENSHPLSIAAILFSKVTSSSSLLIGKGSCCLWLVVGCVVHVSKYRSSFFAVAFFAVVVVTICDLFSYSRFSWIRVADRQTLQLTHRHLDFFHFSSGVVLLLLRCAHSNSDEHL